MSLSVAHLGPPGTYAEEAALAYINWLRQQTQQSAFLCPYPNIPLTLRATAEGHTAVSVVPVENSIEGGVTLTLDTLWQLDSLQIQHALVLPIAHALISKAPSMADIKTVYSHPQALSQCQKWLAEFLPQVQLIPTNSTTEALQHLETDATIAAIASQRAAALYQLPVVVCPIQDYPDNATRFWILGQTTTHPNSSDRLCAARYTSLAFSVPANVPGALVKPLQVLAQCHINLSRIESRPSKRSLGDYVFFMDLEANLMDAATQAALAELATYTEVLKIFGSYSVIQVNAEAQTRGSS